MKTTLELPDDLFHSAKAKAETQGCSLKDFVTEVLRERLKHEPSGAPHGEPVWMAFFGAFAGTARSRTETKRIQAAIDAEFGQVDDME